MELLKWEVSQCHSALSCSKFWKVPIFGKVAYNVVYCIIFCGKKLWIAIVQRKFFFCKLCTQSYRSFDAILQFFIFLVFFYFVSDLILYFFSCLLILFFSDLKISFLAPYLLFLILYYIILYYSILYYIILYYIILYYIILYYII